MGLKNLYLVAAIVGAVVPYVFFGSFIADNGVDLPAFVEGLFVNGAAGGFSADLLITSFVFWVWSYRDAQQLRVDRWWMIPIINLAVGLSAAFPLYLYLRYDAASQNA